MNHSGTAVHAAADSISEYQPNVDRHLTADPVDTIAPQKRLLHLALVISSSALLGAACGWLVALLFTSPNI